VSPFIECAGCGGLKRPETARCPHCRRWLPGSRPLKRALALLGFGTLAACGGAPGYHAMDAYGLPPFEDSGPGTYGTDAYGAPPFRDAGPDDRLPDGGDAGDRD
jgi:hypothetical protein